jgi:predicted NUDIX family NTP pyrophosphohydrolase
MPKSAGILLFRRRPAAEPEVLLVHPGGPFWKNRDRGAWSIPKGLIDRGEESRACAMREFEEELGSPPPCDPDDLVDLGTVRQKSGKLVHAWAVEGDFDPATLKSNTFKVLTLPSGKPREFPEVDRAEWCDPATAREKLNPAQAEFIDRLLERLGSGEGGIRTLEAG